MTEERYIPRLVDGELRELLHELPAVVIEGPKGVGKTATARRLARTEYALDRPQTLEVVRAEPSRALAGRTPILIDEWQRYPPIWDLCRRAIDEAPTPGRFLLVGSASPAGTGTHSGAGRIVTVRMRPLSLAERRIAPPTVSLHALLGGTRPAIGGDTDVGLDAYVHEILAGGFPAIRRTGGRARRALLDGYLDRIIDREIPELGRQVRRPATLRRWMAAYAAATGTTASYETIRDAATPGEATKPAKTTTIPYRDMLERLWILDPIPAWHPSRSHLRRLGAKPRHHLVDPALAARLLGVDRDALLHGEQGSVPFPRDGTLLGSLFESLVALSVRVYAQAAEAQVRHLRTTRGDHEVDLVAVRDDQRVLAIEVKLSATVTDHDVRHLRWLQRQLGDDLLDAVVVTTGKVAYRRPDGIVVAPAVLLGP